MATVMWALALALAGAAAAKGVANLRERLAARDAREEALEGMPLAIRFALAIAECTGRKNAKPKADPALERLLASAGLDETVSIRDWTRMRFVFAIIWPLAWILPCRVLGEIAGWEASSQGLLWAFGALFLALYPGMWLRSFVKRRHLSIVKSLPFVLDVLTLSVEAGLDFMGALQRYAQTPRKNGVLERELGRMLREIQIGIPRRQALAGLARRTNEPNLRGTVHALMQADELGVSVGGVLRIESDQLRERRFDRAEKLANEAPVKMLGPLLFCIFPAVFVILLGPVIFGSAKIF